MFVAGPPCGPRLTRHRSETSLITPDLQLLRALSGCTKSASEGVQGRDRRELPDTLPIARQAKLDGIGDRPRQGEAEDNRPDWSTLLLGRTGDTGRHGL